MCFIGLMIFPVSGLMFFHFHLVAKANTTNEQVQISLSFCLFVSRYGHLLLQVTSKFKNSVNPYDQGCLTNCGTTFCGPLYGKYVEWWKVGRSRILPSMRHQFPYVSRVRRVFSSILQASFGPRSAIYLSSEDGWACTFFTVSVTYANQTWHDGLQQQYCSYG